MLRASSLSDHEDSRSLWPFQYLQYGVGVFYVFNIFKSFLNYSMYLYVNSFLYNSSLHYKLKLLKIFSYDDRWRIHLN